VWKTWNPGNGNGTGTGIRQIKTGDVLNNCCSISGSVSVSVSVSGFHVFHTLFKFPIMMEVRGVFSEVEREIVNVDA